MGGEWLKNLCGSSLDDETMQKIAHPALELGTHVTIKTVQSFGLLGTVLVGPVVAVARAETRNWSGLQHNMTRAGRGGLILGLFAGPLLTYLKVRNETDGYKIWDRCYRLRYNRGQVRVDQASIVGAATGAAVAYGTASAGGAMFGGLVGMSTGILLAAVYNNM
ncbi:uncharacterized protein LOC123547954 [Mercenaria mercenaria]|uniref:uncharacterized protein LOC123547954 n=1 Tax=Mercenaria mercenaria TaxID=6596 RepID=UPI00234FA3F6|nr:uncharacterized protein LOC123547954 [Mercenaria mercenaria]XP_053407350.1 uncharacterized protein LOC123547954 [Mercenaria mercenaria]